jgi:hypothetical protein
LNSLSNRKAHQSLSASGFRMDEFWAQQDCFSMQSAQMAPTVHAHGELNRNA